MRESVEDEVIRELQSLSLPSNAVIVAGYPKTGSHFLLQILGQLNFQRLYDIGEGFVYPIHCKLKFCFQ